MVKWKRLAAGKHMMIAKSPDNLTAVRRNNGTWALTGFVWATDGSGHIGHTSYNYRTLAEAKEKGENLLAIGINPAVAKLEKDKYIRETMAELSDRADAAVFLVQRADVKRIEDYAAARGIEAPEWLNDAIHLSLKVEEIKAETGAKTIVIGVAETEVLDSLTPPPTVKSIVH